MADVEHRSPGGAQHGVNVSVVIPAFNEALRLPPTLRELSFGLNRHFDGDYEVIVSDDGSTDDTSSVVTERAADDHRIRLVRSAIHLGKGYALCAGFADSAGEAVAFLDADLPVDVSTLAAMIARLDDADLVVGSRHMAGSSFVTPQPLGRRAGGRGFRAAVSLLGLRSVSDPQCGAKVLRRSSTETIVAACTTDRFAFDIELIERCRGADLRVIEHPVAWRHVPGSSLRPARDAVGTLFDLHALRRQFRSEKGA